MMLDNWVVSEENWRTALEPDRGAGLPTAPPGFAESESPRFVGRGIAAIAADTDRARWNQRQPHPQDGFSNSRVAGHFVNLCPAVGLRAVDIGEAVLAREAAGG